MDFNVKAVVGVQLSANELQSQKQTDMLIEFNVKAVGVNRHADGFQCLGSWSKPIC